VTPDAAAPLAASGGIAVDSRRSLLVRPLTHAAIIVAVVVGLARALGILWPEGVDFRAYYYADLAHLYTGPYGQDAFLYSPAFAQVAYPLRLLPFSVALGLWTTIELLALVWMAGPWSLPAMLLLAPEWINGNVNLVMAAAIVVGLRHSAGWAFPAFTKASPAVGLAWFAFRGEWRMLARSLAVLAGIFAVSFALSPAAWFDYARFVVDSIGVGSFPQVGGYIPIPLTVRLPFAVALLWWGRNRPWTVPLACSLAMPVMWWSAGMCFVLAALRLRRAGADAPERAPSRSAAAIPMAGVDSQPASERRSSGASAQQPGGLGR
jgi:hypothetical protein